MRGTRQDGVPPESRLNRRDFGTLSRCTCGHTDRSLVADPIRERSADRRAVGARLFPARPAGGRASIRLSSRATLLASKAKGEGHGVAEGPLRPVHRSSASTHAETQSFTGHTHRVRSSASEPARDASRVRETFAGNGSYESGAESPLIAAESFPSESHRRTSWTVEASLRFAAIGMIRMTECPTIRVSGGAPGR